jgi:hypothetical protein
MSGAEMELIIISVEDRFMDKWTEVDAKDFWRFCAHKRGAKKRIWECKEKESEKSEIFERKRKKRKFALFPSFAV